MEEVDRLVKKYGTSDPFKLADCLGTITIFEELGNILGYYNKERRIRMIHINSSISHIKQRIVCAHELGHVVLHANINTAFLKTYTFFSVDKIETQANKFAINLLINGIDIPQDICKNDFLLSLGLPAELGRFI